MCKGSKKIGNGGIKKKFFEKIIFLVFFGVILKVFLLTQYDLRRKRGKESGF